MQTTQSTGTRTLGERKPRSVAVCSVCASLLLCTGCMTKTRVGDLLVPPHAHSAVDKGQEVRAYLVQKSKPKAAGLVAAGTFLAQETLKAVAHEMEKEAARYEAQYGSVVRFDTNRLANGAYLVLLRGKKLPEDGTLTEKAVDDIVHGDFSGHRERDGKPIGSDGKPVKLPRGYFPSLGGDPKEGPRLASAFVLELSRPVGGANVWEVEPRCVCMFKSKAKVVGWSFWPWHWLGGLLLKTSAEVNVAVDIKFEGLTPASASKGSDLGVSVTVPNSTLSELSLPEVALSLSKTGGDCRKYGQACGTWLYIPGVVAMAAVEGQPPQRVGFASARITVTESDPSNVRRLLVSGAKRITDTAESTDWQKFSEGVLP